MDFIHDPYLVFYAPLWKRDGTSFISDDAYGHLCTVVGALWTPQGRSFDGNDYITINPTASKLQTLTTGSIELWVKLTTAVGAQAFFSVSDSADADSRFILYWNPENGIYAYCAEAGTVYYNNAFKLGTTTPLMVADVWYHLLLTHNGITPALYLDNVALTIATGGADYTKFLAAVLTINDVSLGTNNISTGRQLFLNGTEGEARIYNRVLSALENQHNYLATKWRFR